MKNVIAASIIPALSCAILLTLPDTTAAAVAAWSLLALVALVAVTGLLAMFLISQGVEAVEQAARDARKRRARRKFAQRVAIDVWQIVMCVAVDYAGMEGLALALAVGLIAARLILRLEYRQLDQITMKRFCGDYAAGRKAADRDGSGRVEVAEDAAESLADAMLESLEKHRDDRMNSHRWSELQEHAMAQAQAIVDADRYNRDASCVGIRNGNISHTLDGHGAIQSRSSNNYACDSSRSGGDSSPSYSGGGDSSPAFD